MRILCYGDSLTAGFCTDGKCFEPYGRFLSSALRAAGHECVVKICGLNGLTAAEMLKEVASPALKDVVGHVGKGLSRKLDEEGDLDLVIIMAGTNDMAVDRPNAQAVFNQLRGLHEICHARSIPTIALAPPGHKPPAHRAARLELRGLLARWAHETLDVAAFADCEEMVPRTPIGTNLLWDPDYIHMNPRGSKTLGHQILPVVLKVLGAQIQPGALHAQMLPGTQGKAMSSKSTPATTCHAGGYEKLSRRIEAGSMRIQITPTPTFLGKFSPRVVLAC
jgi:lysophospholipase L1-like esterase